MLHENVLMEDIDVNHWRNLQSLLLDSAKARRRIVVIHEEGVVEKLVHSSRLPVRNAVDKVADPHEVARRLYDANRDEVDFVAVFERHAFDEYFGRFQGTWNPDEDLDVFVHRTYAFLDEYPDGIVTAPEPPRQTLGLQWRVGAGYDDVRAAVECFVEPQSCVVFGIFDERHLWATLVLGFDADRRLDILTTADVSRLSGSGTRAAVAGELFSDVEHRFRRCNLALIMSLTGARRFLQSGDKARVLAEMQASGDLAGSRLPSALERLLTQGQ